MKVERASAVDSGAVQQILDGVRDAVSIKERIARISESFLGHPYRSVPLVGSAEIREVLVAPLDGFDCVTFVETVWALAYARSASGFLRQLRRLRYASGEVRWNKRNHYMTDWVRNNRREGLAREVALSKQPTVKERTLDAVPGLRTERRRFRCYPKPLALRKHSKLESGDMILFASTRPFLDVFHVGLIVKKDGRAVLRHASRSQGGVVEQEMADFLKKNRMAGVIVVRPVPPAAERART